MEGGGIAHGKPVITAVRPARRDDAAMPFIGLAEAYALAEYGITADRRAELAEGGVWHFRDINRAPPHTACGTSQPGRLTTTRSTVPCKH